MFWTGRYLVRKKVKALVRKQARRLGYDVVRFSAHNSETARIYRMLQYYGVDLILDVGANIGQYAQGLREAGFKGRIISFEPLSAAHHVLVQAGHKDPYWTVAPRAAIGNAEGTIEIHVSANSVSSSILEILDLHRRVAPQSEYVGSEHVPLVRLDTIARDYLTNAGPIFLKIDTQGYERHVLEGARGVLDRVVGVQAELSLAPLYKGQLLFDEMVAQLRQEGYRLYDLFPELTDPESGRLLQANGIFFRPQQQ